MLVSLVDLVGNLFEDPVVEGTSRVLAGWSSWAPSCLWLGRRILRDVWTFSLPYRHSIKCLLWTPQDPFDALVVWRGFLDFYFCVWETFCSQINECRPGLDTVIERGSEPHPSPVFRMVRFVRKKDVAPSPHMPIPSLWVQSSLLQSTDDVRQTEELLNIQSVSCDWRDKVCQGHRCESKLGSSHDKS